MPSEQAFLSYSRTDLAAANELRDLLRHAGIDAFKDDASLRSGDRWLERLQKAVAECGAFIVLVGRDGVQRWVGAEVEVALVRHLSPRGDAPRLPIHPILLGDTAPEALPPFLALFQSEHWAPGMPLPDGLRDALLQGALRLDSAPPFEGCPFLGLSTFGSGDADLFFGRRTETLQALAGLGDQLQTAPDRLRGGGGAGYVRWLQIEGHSGSGKSSLVHAGLLPLVERGALWPRTGFTHWRVLDPMKPGRAPVERLAEVLVHGLKTDGKAPDMHERIKRLLDDERALAYAIRECRQDDTAFLLVIDQFEELYTLAGSEQRAAFDARLAEALLDADCPLFVVSTVRSDFLDRIEQLPRLSALYNQRCKRYLLPTITSEGLREAIELPARRAGLDVSEVATAMLQDARDEPGALPLVENALLQLWQQRQDRKLSGEVYRQRGGLAGMLSTGADALLERIDRGVPKGRLAALELLLRLTRINADGRHTRQRITRDEAVQVAGDGRDDIGERVLQMLSGERPEDRPSNVQADNLRLVTTGMEGETPYADLIHETLLRARRRAADNAAEPYWPTLYGYIDSNRDRDMLRQQLALQVERWKRSGAVVRWFRLAGWSQLLKYRRLRMGRNTADGRFLALSRRVAAPKAAVVVLVSAALLESVWWVSVNNLPFAYVFIQPLWYLGWEPKPQTVPLPAGSFAMGCRAGRDVDAGQKCPDHEPFRQVELSRPCTLGKYEVTFLEYDRYVWANGGKGAVPGRYPSDAGFGRLARPVVNVTWHDAQAYAAWLSKATGDTYRLPSDAEWEYAARGGLDARYPWGDESPRGRANCGECGDEFSGKSTSPAGQYPANKFGLHDMAGNVWEWVEDERDEASRVLRGGSWFNDARVLRAANRLGGHPVSRNVYIGFRVCRGSPIETPAAEPLPTGSPAR